MAALLLALMYPQEPAGLIDRLRSDTVEERQEAVRALLELGEQARTALESAAKDADAEVAGQARRILRVLEVRAIIGPRLRKELPDAERRILGGDAHAWTEVFRAATSVQSGQPMLPGVRRSDLDRIALDALRGARGDERPSLCWTAANLGLRSAIPGLADFLRDASREVREQAHRALVELRAPASALAGLHGDPHPDARAAALATLTALRDGSAREAGLAALADPAAPVRAAAIDYLASLGDPAVLPRLAPLASDPDAAPRLRFVHAVLALRAPDRNALVKLLDDPQAEIVVNAMRVLAELRERAAAPGIRARLSNETWWVRCEAAMALAKLRSREDIPAVAALLKDPEDAVRTGALHALNEFGARERQAEVVDALRDPDDSVRYWAIKTLRGWKARDAAGRIVPLLDDPDNDVRAEAVEALAELDAREALPALTRRLKDLEEDVREQAVKALVALRPDNLLEILIPLLGDASAGVRHEAREGLKPLDYQAGVAALAAHLDSAESEIRRFAAELLEDLGTAEVLAELGKRMDVPNGDARAEILALALRLRGREGGPAALAALKDPSAAVRSVAVEHLATQDPAAAMPGLLRALEDPEPDVRRDAISSLVRLRAKDAEAALVARLKDESPEVRVTACVALRSLELFGAVPGLLPLLDDEDGRVRHEALYALAQSKSKDLIPRFRKDLASESPSARGTAISMLSQLDPEGSAPEILKCLDDPDVSVRRWAINAAYTAFTPGTAARLRRMFREEPELMTYALGPLAVHKDPGIVPDLVAMIEKGDGPLTDLLSQVHRFQAKEAIPAIRKQLTSPDDLVRNAAVYALAGLGDTDAIPDMTRQLLSSDGRVQEGHLSSLASLKPAAHVDLLRPLLRDPAPLTRRGALTAIGRLKIRAAAPDVVRLLADPELAVRQDALHAIAALNVDGTAPEVAKLLTDRLPEVRLDALRALIGMGAREEARLGLRDADPRIRREALLAAETADLVALMEDIDVPTRNAAMDALARHGAREAVPPLLKRLETDPDAAEGLAALGAAEAVEGIAAHFRRRPDHALAGALARLGDRRGAYLLLRGGRDALFVLNTLRRPAAWKRLRETRVPAGMPTWGREAFEAIARAAGLELRVDPDAEPLLAEAYVYANRPTLLSLLEDPGSRSVGVVLDEGVLRVLAGDAADRFWRAWWAAESKR